MALIRVRTDPFDPGAVTEHQHTGAYIDWLTRTYPQGFGRPHKTWVNGRPLQVPGYDLTIGEHDTVELVLLPAAPVGAAIVQAVVGALISAAISYVANALFGSKPPSRSRRSRASTPAARRVNSLGLPTNTARIGEPIPVQYGRIRSTPDLAAEPYRFYSGNNQFIAAILCLGHGEFDVHEVYVSDTPASQLGGVVSYAQYGPTAHGSAMGAIEAGSSIYEDIETSVEVGDQELQVVQATTSSITERWVQAWAIQDPTTSSVTLRVADPGSVLREWEGDSVTVTEYEASVDSGVTVGSVTVESTAEHSLLADTSTGDVTGTVTVTSDVTQDSSSVTIGDQTWSEVQSYTATLSSVADQTVALSGTSAAPNTSARLYLIERSSGGLQESAPVAAGEIGPYPAVAPGKAARAIQVDVELPGGLYRLNDETGGLLPASIELQVKVYAVADDGTLGALLNTHTETINESTNTPQRRTYTYTVGAPQRVAASVSRTTPPSDRAQDQSRAIWTGLRGVRTLSTGTSYGDVTLLAVQIRATEGISSAAADLISVDCSRRLDGVATSNPALALQDAYTSAVYGGRRPVAELDGTALSEMETELAAHNGFNFRFDSRLAMWDAMQAICRVGDYYPVPQGGEISVARDAAQSIDVMAFTAANMIDAEVLSQFDRANATDGYRVQYTDPTTGQESYVLHPAASADPEDVALDGCTDAATAQQFAEGLWARQQYRRQYLTWTTELEGHLAPIGARISVDHPLVGVGSWVVQSADTVDQQRVRLTAFRYDERQYA